MEAILYLHEGYDHADFFLYSETMVLHGYDYIPSHFLPLNKATGEHEPRTQTFGIHSFKFESLPFLPLKELKLG